MINTAETSQLVGLSGTFGSGKDTLADYLVDKYSFMHVSTGDVLRAEADRQGKDIKRDILIELGVELREDYGSLGALVLKGVEQWEDTKEKFIGGLVISGLRVLGEAQELKDQDGTLLFVDAPVHERFIRLLIRNRDTEVERTIGEFMANEKIEFEGLGDETKPHLKAIKAISDHIVQNDTTKEEYFQKAEKILSLS